jgi:hypothetical protein
MSLLRFADFNYVSGVLTLSVRVFVSRWRLSFSWDPSLLLSLGDICNKLSTLHSSEYFHDSRTKRFFTKFFRDTKASIIISTKRRVYICFSLF